MRLRRRRPPRESDELEAFLAAARAAAEGVDLDHSLRTILDAAIDLVGADEGSIQLLDRGTLSVVASRGLSADARGHVVAVGEGISGTVAASGRALLLRSPIDVERFHGFLPKERPIVAAICAPLRARAGTLGVLNVDRTRGGRSFTERDLRLVTLFAEAAALTIEKSRLLEESRQREADLERLRAAGMRLTSSLALETVADAALNEALELAASRSGFLCIVGEGSAAVTLARFRGLPRDVLRSVLGHADLRALIERGDHRLVRDAAAEPALAPLAPALGGNGLALVPLRTAEGRPDGLLGIVLPRRAEAVPGVVSAFAGQAGLAIANALLHRQLESKERELETVVTSVSVPMVLVAADGRFRAINPAAAQALSLSARFEEGQPARGKLPAELGRLLLDRTDDVAAEVALPGRTGERLWRATVSTVRSGPRAGGRLLVLADLTAQRDLEARKKEFVAVIGHELRTPLTNIKGYAETLLRHVDSMSPDLRAKSIRTIAGQSERLEGLIEDLLALSRIESHGLPLRLAPEDVAALCASVVEDARRRRPDRTIAFRAPDAAIVAVTDRIKVEQVLSHLLDNALKYSDDGQEVSVGVTADDGEVSIAVRDAGVGIFSGDLPRLFRPFAQLDSSTTRRHGGTGVGLFISKTLAEALGGRIAVRSALGKGSVFTVTLPRESRPAPQVGQDGLRPAAQARSPAPPSAP